MTAPESKSFDLNVPSGLRPEYSSASCRKVSPWPSALSVNA